MYICVTPKPTFDFDKILHQQCTICWQSNCQISIKFAKGNNSYSSFCEVTLKHFSFRSSRLTSSTTTWKWCVLESTDKSHCNYCLV